MHAYHFRHTPIVANLNNTIKKYTDEIWKGISKSNYIFLCVIMTERR